MITLRKLLTLKDDTRRRKFPLIMQEIEKKLLNDQTINSIYLTGFLEIISKDRFYSDQLILKLIKLRNEYSQLENEDLIRWCNEIRYELLSSIGAEPGDWDFNLQNKNNLELRKSGEMYLFLDGIRSPFNVGSIFRSAESFGIKKIFISKDTASPDHKRSLRTSMGCTNVIPWSYCTIEEVKGPVFALELGGISLKEYPFPKEGTLIIGSEELGISPKARISADESLGRLSIVTGGLKGSLNVSVSTGIALQRWFVSVFPDF